MHEFHCHTQSVHPNFPASSGSLLSSAVSAQPTSETNDKDQSSSASDQRAGDLVIVVGASGQKEFAEQFSQWADRWEQAGRQGGVTTTRMNPGDEEDDDQSYQTLQSTIKTLIGRNKQSPIWIVLIGHGSFDGRVAKFNLTGRDVASNALAEWLAPSETSGCCNLHTVGERSLC